MLRGLLGGYARGRRQTSSATLSLNFLDGINDSRITYSGGANGTRVNSAGVIVAATTPRYDYNPVTLAARGLLVEEARTNLLLRSAEFDNASWTKTRATITANATTAPDGTLTGDKIVSDATAANTHDIRQQVTVSDTTFALSIYFKAAECTWALIEVQNTAATSNRARAWFNLATGVVGAGNTAGAGVTYVSHSITNAGGGWYRCSLTCTTALTGLQVFIEPTTGDNITHWSGNSTDGAFVWGVQLEAGAFPTSYIPTTTAAVTRTADSAVMTGTNFSSWYNQTQGTFVAKSSAYGIATESPILTAQDNPLNDSYHRLSLLGATQRTRYQSANVTVQADISPANAVAIGNQFTAAFAYAANDFAACLNAGTVVTDSSGTVPIDIAVLAIGAGGYLSQLNGHVQSIAFYPRRMADSQLQTLTA